MRLFTAHGINIHSCHARMRKAFFQLLFNSFCTEIPLHKLVAAAGSANMHRRIRSAAVMALQPVGELVKRKAHITVTALRYPAAHLANLVRRVTAAVLE